MRSGLGAADVAAREMMAKRGDDRIPPRQITSPRTPQVTRESATCDELGEGRLFEPDLPIVEQRLGGARCRDQNGRSPLTESGMFGARDGYIHRSQEMYDQAGLIREFVKWD